MTDCILIDSQGAAALQTEVNGVRRWGWLGYLNRDSLEAFALARGLQVVECKVIGAPCRVWPGGHVRRTVAERK
jgi:hypothetical protein